MVDFLMAYFPEIDIQIGNNVSRDAYGRLRVSSPGTLFDSQLIHDKAPLFWDESIVDGSGNATSTHSTTHARVQMYVENGDTVHRQTYQRIPYQPGKSQLVLMTNVVYTGQTGVTKEWGLGDLTDGIFFEQDATTLGITIQKAGSNTTVTQSNWNIDKLDGTGISGFNLDVTKAQIWFIEFEWLGVGAVTFGVVDEERTLRPCHRVENANNSTSVYTSKANLPVFYRIVSTSGSSTFDQICCTVMSEGARRDTGLTRGHDNSTTIINANAAGTYYCLVGLRLKSGYDGTVVIPTDIEVMTITNDAFNWRLILNPTFANATAWTSLTNSGVETTIGNAGSPSNSTVTAGTVLASGYGYNGSVTSAEVHTDRWIGKSIGGTYDQLILAASPLTANADLVGAINWRESP